MKCAFCGVVVPDDRVTYGGEPICLKCIKKGFGVLEPKLAKVRGVTSDQP